jgi:nicotinamide mononucleotide transporter
MTEFLISDRFIEILAAITGIVYLYFSIKQNIWLWFWGILNALLFVFVFFHAKFYAGMVLQFYYFGISIYGWYFWKKGYRKDGVEQLPVIRANSKEWIFFIVLTLLLTIVAGFSLDEYSDSPLPYWDAFTTAGSVIATWMLARKYLEQWIMWIVIDMISLGTYFYRGLYPTALLFSVYTVMALIGYYQWKKELKNTEI